MHGAASANTCPLRALHCAAQPALAGDAGSADSVAEAVAVFNNRQADAVAGWEPDIYEAEASGGTPLLSSNQLRIVIDVIVTSREAIDEHADLVQDFHNAWFATLKAQFEDFDNAASQIAAWGHNDWSFVYPETASDDLRAWLENVAQADLSDNATVMRDTRPIINRLEIARRVWAAADLSAADEEAATWSMPVCQSRRSTGGAGLTGEPVNNTFSIGANIDLSTVGSETPRPRRAALPQLTFLPDSTELTIESRRILDSCVVPTMSQSVGLLLEVRLVRLAG